MSTRSCLLGTVFACQGLRVYLDISQTKHRSIQCRLSTSGQRGHETSGHWGFTYVCTSRMFCTLSKAISVSVCVLSPNSIEHFARRTSRRSPVLVTGCLARRGRVNFRFTRVLPSSSVLSYLRFAHNGLTVASRVLSARVYMDGRALNVLNNEENISRCYTTTKIEGYRLYIK
ncbi:hypothetical protein PLICRDRAFT_523055 [Plicaturopsis crispa FD-325 SS-3]|nr:hypothetical protein PLICRDRAFT_523055 [Plicaturopsis crispa FD-325 SS-3]